jgi:hypothetical protein
MVSESKIVIFDLAEANKGHLKKEYQRVKNKCDKNKSDLLENFRKKVQEDWNLSINMKERALSNFLNSGEYKNIYDLKEMQADQLVDMGELEVSELYTSMEEALRKQLKKFYESRKAFDSSIKDGEKIKYTALNIGGTGINKYARYCVIIKREDAQNYNTLAFIKRDSAIHYVENENVLIEKLTKDVSNKECMDILAALKHEGEIESVAADRWPTMVCCDTSYIEAVTVDGILSSHIKIVRIDKTYYDSIYKDSLLKLFYSELSEEEQYRLAFFECLLTQLEEQSIELEIIDES